MPLNCPDSFGIEMDCLACRHAWNEVCNYYVKSPRSIKDILTPSERLDNLEREWPQPDNYQQNQIDQLKAKYLYMEEKLQEHLSFKKKAERL